MKCPNSSYALVVARNGSSTRVTVARIKNLHLQDKRGIGWNESWEAAVAIPASSAVIFDSLDG